MKVDFTKEELYWIERTADIEGARAMMRLMDLVQTDTEKLDKKEKETLKKIGSELSDLYNFLKNLRNKLEKLREGND